jgi:hypothetical protein
MDNVKSHIADIVQAMVHEHIGDQIALELGNQFGQAFEVDVMDVDVLTTTLRVKPLGNGMSRHFNIKVSEVL